MQPPLTSSWEKKKTICPMKWMRRQHGIGGLSLQSPKYIRFGGVQLRRDLL